MKNNLKISEYDLIKADACTDGKNWFNKKFKNVSLFKKFDFKEVVEKCPHKYLGWAIMELPWRYSKFTINTKSVVQLKRIIKLPCLLNEESIDSMLRKYEIKWLNVLTSKQLRVKKELKLRGVI